MSKEILLAEGMPLNAHAGLASRLSQTLVRIGMPLVSMNVSDRGMYPGQFMLNG